VTVRCEEMLAAMEKKHKDELRGERRKKSASQRSIRSIDTAKSWGDAMASSSNRNDICEPTERRKRSSVTLSEGFDAEDARRARRRELQGLSESARRSGHGGAITNGVGNGEQSAVTIGEDHMGNAQTTGVATGNVGTIERQGEGTHMDHVEDSAGQVGGKENAQKLKGNGTWRGLRKKFRFSLNLGRLQAAALGRALQQEQPQPQQQPQVGLQDESGLVINENHVKTNQQNLQDDLDRQKQQRESGSIRRF